MTYGRKILIGTLSLGSALSAQIPNAPFTLNDGGREQTYILATDELYRKSSYDQKGQKLKEPMGQNQELVTKAASLEAKTGDTFDLVLYPQGETPTRANRRTLTRQVLVHLDSGADIKKIAEQAGASKHSVPEYAPDYLILTFAKAGDSLSQLETVRALDGVLSADPLLGRQMFKRSTTPNVPSDPLYAYSQINSSYQWHLKNTGENSGTDGVDANVEPVWADYLGAGITIGIVDDGLQTDHPDLAANVNTAIDRNWNSGDANDPNPSPSTDDHGTSVGGVIAAVRSNSIGGTGAAPSASLVGMRLIAQSVSDVEEAEAIAWRNDAIQIKNHSWGPNDDPIPTAPGPLTLAAFETSIASGRSNLGTIHVWAAGNGGDNDNVNYDGYANSIYTIATGAVNDKGARSDYSEPGTAKVISAPSDGSGIDQGITTTTTNSNYTSSFGGTSSATPLLAGIIALMLEANPNLGWRDVQEILIRTARKINPSDSSWADNGAGFPFSHDYGSGLVDAMLAVSLAEDWTTNLGTHLTYSDSKPSLSQSIPDNSTTGTQTSFTVSNGNSFRIEHVRVRTTITHADRGELTITLTSPSGKESILGQTASISSSAANYSDWTFMSVHHWGETSEGTWTLKVVDSVSGNTGTLGATTIEFFGASAPTISAAPTIINRSIYAYAGNSFYHRIYAKENATGYTAGTLPSGLNFDTATGVISGTPTSTGSFVIPVSATNAIGTTNENLSIEVINEPPRAPLVLGETATAQQGISFSYQIAASEDPTSYTATPLPAGLSLNSSTGVISGTPTTIASTEVALTATNATGSGNSTLTLSVIAAVTSDYAEALDNSNYTYQVDGPGNIWTNQSTVSNVGGDALQSPPVDHGETAGFSTEVTGPGVLSFWARTSTEEGYDFLTVTVGDVTEFSLSGDADWQQAQIELVDGSHFVTWSYERDSTTDGGTNQVWVDGLSFTAGPVDVISLPVAADFMGLDWPASSGWKGQTTTNRDGTDALESKQLGHGTEATLSLDITGPGTLSFYYKVSSEANYDLFTFTANSTQKIEQSGDVDWTLHQEVLPSGTSTVIWRYSKDSSVSSGQDRAWVDQVTWVRDGVSGYENWKSIYFTPTELNTSSVTANNADPDLDLLPNLLEYGTGNTPTSISGDTLPTVSFGTSTISMDYQVDTSRTDVSVTGQESNDLENWSTSTHTVVSSDGDIETRRISIPISTSSGAKEFLRIDASVVE